MKRVTIHRCPVCSSIGAHTDQLVAELRKDPDVRVTIEQGEKGEFTVEVDGRLIPTRRGDELIDVPELAAEIHEVETPV